MTSRFSVLDLDDEPFVTLPEASPTPPKKPVVVSVSDESMLQMRPFMVDGIEQRLTWFEVQERIAMKKGSVIVYVEDSRDRQQ